jgi:subtilisin family serine protease
MTRYLGWMFLLASVPATLAGAEGRYIVRTSDGISSLLNVCRLVGCNVVRTLDGTLNRLFLVTTPLELPLSVLRPVLQLTGKLVSIELDINISLGTSGKLVSVPDGLNDRTLVDLLGSPVWNGYASQPASGIVRLPEARAQYGARGGGTVAVIDTGIDSTHPALRSVVLTGYDFLSNQPGANTEGGVQQSTAAVLDGGGGIGLLNQATAAVLSLPLLSFLSLQENQAVGHGTEVAGLIHLVAPRAMLLPLRAFRPDGTGYLSDVLRALYYATANNANIVNMSFSFGGYSPEFRQAVDYAQRRGLVLVASAGNNGSDQAVYPAAFPGVIGVGSTNSFDQRSSFSNYGSQLVWVAAPGEQLITSYPYSTYSAVSGTSFSTAIVSGTVSLMLDRGQTVNQTQARDALAQARWISSQMGNGRLDMVRALGKAFGSW